MSWDEYVRSLTSEGTPGSQVIQSAAIWSNDKDCPALWATSPNFNTEVGDIHQLHGDHANLFINGVRVAGQKCVLVKDELNDEKSNIMNLRTQKDSEGNLYYLSIGKSLKCFIIVKGSQHAQGGQVAQKLYETVHHLRLAGY